MLDDETLQIDDELETGDDEIELEIDQDSEIEEEPQAEVKEPAKEPIKEPAKEQELEKQEKYVPLSALEAERKKWKERLNDPAINKSKTLLDKIQKATGKDIDTILAEMDSYEIDRHVEAGVDPEIAKEIVKQRRETEEVRSILKKQQRDLEFESLKSDSFYSDAENFREDLEEYVDTKGVSLEEAYWAKFGKNKIADLERSIEQRILNNLNKKQTAKVDTTANGQVDVKPKINLSSDEIAIAKAAKMTPQEYMAMKNMSNTEQYSKFKTKKG